MKILLLADAHSVHTIKWAKSLNEAGLEIGIFSLNKKDDNPYESNKNIKVFYFFNTENKSASNVFCKLNYLRSLNYLKHVLDKFRPDIIHAHYATSYGLIGALIDFHPYIISVWGSDVFDFPNVSFLHKKIIKYNFSKADKILSTSNIMAKETIKYTNKNIIVTPFGVDLEKFKPQIVDSLFSNESIIVGTIKTLEEKYGIEYLIRAFNIVKKRNCKLSLKLLIVGDGSKKVYLEKLVKNLGISEDTIFTGKIEHSLIPTYDNMLSVSVSVSDSESFGVAVIEASACGKPVVVSNVGGLPEVVEDNITGLIVPPRNPEKTAEAIEKLILDKTLREKMGNAGRQRVKELYDWNNNVKQMINIYKEVLR